MWGMRMPRLQEPGIRMPRLRGMGMWGIGMP
jgi:hypothetical protein